MTSPLRYLASMRFTLLVRAPLRLLASQVLLIAVILVAASQGAIASGALGAAKPIAAASRLAKSSALKITFDARGLASLQQGGIEMLSDGGFSVQGVLLRGWNGDTQPGDTQNPRVRFDAARRVVEQIFSWGTVRCVFAPAGNRLNMTVQVSNTSDDVIQNLSLQLMTLRFPQAPRGWVPHYPYFNHNAGEPSVNIVDYETGALAVCNEDIGRPLLLGFPGRESLTTRPLWISTAPIHLSPYLDPVIARPIYPGGSDTYRLSLRFGSSGATAAALAGDVLRRFAAAYPPTLKWNDRRPIGTLHLSTSEPNFHSPDNPRGWFADPKNVDITTETGRAAFKTRLLSYADNSIRVLRETGAQGMIVWDVEGQQWPHATSYLGDPRSLPSEIEPIADEFFARFRAAGLRTGICIRPQRPVRAAYSDAVFQSDVADMESNLSDKIALAKKRWGCTLFYVDSNGDPNVPFDALLFKRVAARHPDVLLIPEHQNALYYAYTAPYDELRGGGASTPDRVRQIYPGAFGAIYVPDGPLDAKRAELTAAVKRGDILMFRAWFDDEYNAKVKSIYREANAK